jgi:hypothetical protein
MSDHHEDELIAQVTHELRQSAEIDPTFDRRVMNAVRELPVPGAGLGNRALRWFLRPRTVRVSPLSGLALAAALAGLIFGGVRVLSPRPSPAPVEAARPGEVEARLVQFVLVAPEAARVSLVGDFNDWDETATSLEPSASDDGLWSVRVPLPPGRHQYAFVVDGTQWLADPAAPVVEPDDFGTPNSVVTVAEAS